MGLFFTIGYFTAMAITIGLVIAAERVDNKGMVSTRGFYLGACLAIIPIVNVFTIFVLVIHLLNKAETLHGGYIQCLSKPNKEE